MNARTKSILILAGTLLLGGGLGAFTTGAVLDRRMERLHALRTRQGFSEMMEEALAIDDAAQRERVRPVLDRTSTRLRTLWQTFEAQRAAAVDSMRTELAPLLDAEQQRRLDAWMAARAHKHGRGGRPKGP